MDADTERRFDKVDEDIAEIKTLLSGNGGVGLCEKVRNVEGTHKNIKRAVWVFGAAVVSQFAIWIKGIITGS